MSISGSCLSIDVLIKWLTEKNSRKQGQAINLLFKILSSKQFVFNHFGWSFFHIISLFVVYKTNYLTHPDCGDINALTGIALISIFRQYMEDIDWVLICWSCAENQTEFRQNKIKCFNLLRKNEWYLILQAFFYISE